MGTLHLGSAGALFGAFIYFAWFLFPKSRGTGESLTLEKRVRRGLYLACGAVMAVCIAWAAFRAWEKQDVFWLESIALWAFALSWFAKARAEKAAKALVLRAVGSSLPGSASSNEPVNP